MMYKILGVLAFLCIIACSDAVNIKPKLVVVSGDFAERTNVFAYEFLKELNLEEEPGNNFFVSPLGLHMALGMLLNGSDNDSKTELLNTLKLNGLSDSEINKSYQQLIEGLPQADPKVVNTLANSIWQDQNFTVEPSFINVLKESFKAELYREDFSSQETLDKINQWASDHTNAKVKKVLDEISQDQIMFLINALYFKGDWSQQFDKKNTYKTGFNGLSRITQVDMMSRRDTIAYGAFDKFQMAELSYGSGQYAMTIILPEQEQSMDQFINQLDQQTVKDAIAGLKVQKVDLEMPKIKMEYSIKLNDILSKMGMPTLFGSGADLSKIAPPAGRLKVGFVKQDSYVDINEEGTEAAAVTTIGIEVTSVPNYPRFACNRPFIFLIREKSSNTVQFIGKIVNL